MAYRKYWDKSFVVDLSEVDRLHDYIEYVPTAWIDKYILTVKTSHPDFDFPNILLSRVGGLWHVKAGRAPDTLLSRNAFAHVKERLDWLRRNMLSDNWIQQWLAKQDSNFAFDQDTWIESGEVAMYCSEKKGKANRKKITKRRNKRSERKSKPAYKRPPRPLAKAQKVGCRATLPRPGPLSESRRLRVLESRMELPKGKAPLSRTELLRMLVPRMGFPRFQTPIEIEGYACAWECFSSREPQYRWIGPCKWLHGPCRA